MYQIPWVVIQQVGKAEWWAGEGWTDDAGFATMFNPLNPQHATDMRVIFESHKGLNLTVRSLAEC